LAVAVLAVALLNATPGVCFCAHAGSRPISNDAGPGSCCHRATLSLHNANTACCQVERAEHVALSADALAAAPAPTSLPFAFARIDAPLVIAGWIVRPPGSASPPILALRC
jgi:hypothetical protein